MDNASSVIEARRLCKTYGSGPSAVKVLRGVNIEVQAGEYVVILGPSGSGKSTLLNILGLMDEPTQGELFFSQQPVAGISEAKKAALRNRSIGFVFQFDSLLPEFTILENVLMPGLIRGHENNLEKRALELLAGLGLQALPNRFPSEVSGGERQRVALCRALINKPTILLADEPTGNLDKHNGELVFKDLKELARRHGVAVVMVTHNESAGSYASRILHMLDGEIASQGEALAHDHKRNPEIMP